MADDSEPDLLLSLEEGFHTGIRRCRSVKRFQVEDQSDYLLVQLDPIPEDKIFSGRSPEDRYLILAPRWLGQSVIGTDDLPVPVSVLLPLAPNSSAFDALSIDQTSFIAIGQLSCTGRPQSSTNAIKAGTIRPLPIRKSLN